MRVGACPVTRREPVNRGALLSGAPHQSWHCFFYAWRLVGPLFPRLRRNRKRPVDSVRLDQELDDPRNLVRYVYLCAVLQGAAC